MTTCFAITIVIFQLLFLFSLPMYDYTICALREGFGVKSLFNVIAFNSFISLADLTFLGGLGGVVGGSGGRGSESQTHWASRYSRDKTPPLLLFAPFTH